MSHFKKILKPVYRGAINFLKWNRRIGLKYTDFSIISNNCAGGYIYQYYGISYKTPTEGIGMSVDDYLKLIRNPKYYFSQDLEFVNPESTERYESGEHFTYPAAKISDITVYFRHYPTKEVAEDKWKRRSSRINYQRMFFLLSESETMREEHVAAFNRILHNTNSKGALLTTKFKPKDNAHLIDSVPIIKGVPQWKPSIILSCLNWKKIINSL